MANNDQKYQEFTNVANGQEETIKVPLLEIIPIDAPPINEVDIAFDHNVTSATPANEEDEQAKDE